MRQLDLVLAADPRLAGAEGRALAAVLSIAAAAGYRTALLPVSGPAPMPARAWHGHVRALLDRRAVALLDPAEPVEVPLALAWHWLPFWSPALRPARLVAERVLLRIDQPLPQADELSPALDPLALAAEAATILGGPAELVAGDPLIARDAELSSLPPWAATIPGTPAAGLQRSGLLGRHAAGGQGAFARAALMGKLTEARWRSVFAEAAAERLLLEPELGFGPDFRPGELADPAAFLAGLDAWVMLTEPDWRPFLPAALLEALAMARLTILPPALAPLIGEAALLALPTTADLDERIEDEAGAARTREAALELWRRLASPEALIERLRRELGPPPGRSSLVTIGTRRGSRRQRRVLFLSPNGIGMGHITRLLAIARRLPTAIEPVFLTMSQGLGVVRELGFLAEYTPYLNASRESAHVWRQHFRARLLETIAFYDPSMIVFDGNVPYQGLVDCITAHPDRPFVWLRRALWRSEAGRDTVDRARHFELVIEPGELAESLDRGITVARRDEVVRVGPIVLLDHQELLDGPEARAELGLDPAKTTVLVQLGGRNNFDYRDIDRALALMLGTDPGVQVVVVDWLIGEARADHEPSFRRIEAYPTSRWLNAFDFAVSAAGYNSFHELSAAGLPTIWVPNENPMMDEQELRALWAEQRGIAFLARAGDPHRLAWAIRRLRDPRVRSAMRAGSRLLEPCDGAGRAAALIEELACAHPATRSGELLPATLTR